MREIDSPLGGEMSGHIFFKERWFGFDDGTYAGCRLLEILSRSADAGACAQRAAHQLSTPELECAHASKASRTALVAQLAGPRRSLRAPAVVERRLTACGWTGPMVLAWCAPPTPRRCWCCALRATRQAALERIQAAMLALLHTVVPDATFDAPAH